MTSTSTRLRDAWWAYRRTSLRAASQHARRPLATARRMPDSIWKLSLELFRELVAQGPVPASASVSAASASFALSLVAMAVKASARRSDFAGDPMRAHALADAAQSGSALMMRHADDDIAAFGKYLGSLRMPKLSAEELAQRQLATDAALRKATETPLEAARAAARGIELCTQAAQIVHSSVAADLAGAAALLAGAVRALLLAVDSNLGRLKPSSEFHKKMCNERRQLEDQVTRQAAQIENGLAALGTQQTRKQRPQ